MGKRSTIASRADFEAHLGTDWKIAHKIWENVQLSDVAGPTGPAGADGVDGSTILNGTGAPAAGTGVNGDFYIDTATWKIYGPKAAGAWPAGVDLLGADGADGSNGTNGLTILNGSGAPGAGLGTNGDFYIDTTAKAIYGPKAGGAWGSPTSLIGPEGDAGDPGGMRSGAGAPNNGDGVDGEFYIDTTNWHIHGPKTSGAWPAGVDLVGPKGDTGEQGPGGGDFLVMQVFS